MQFDIGLEEQLPRKAYFKVGKSVNKTVLKKEIIQYPADKNTVTVKTQPEILRFLISGDCLLDGRESYFSLRLKTNTFTAFLSDGITSIIKKITIKLPSNSNQVLEEIDNYNCLASIIQMVRLDDDRMISNWQTGTNMLSNHNRAESQRRSRRFLNLNEGGYRTFTFQLNLSSILFHEQYLPLSLLNGILLEVHLASANEAMHYDSNNEVWSAVFDQVEGMYFDQATYDAFAGGKKTTIQNQLKQFYNRPTPNNQNLEYEVQAFVYHAAAVWMNAEYVKRLTAKATSAGGINIFFDSYRFNQIAPEQSLVLHFNSTEQFQNLKRILFLTLNRNRLQAGNEHSFNIFNSFIKSYKFRIGSRSWHEVRNDEEALSYNQTLLSLGGLHKLKSNSIQFTTYPRTQNIHVFDFEKVHDETHSGEDTTAGRNLRMEMQFQSHADIQLIDENNAPIAGPDGNPMLLKRGVNPNQCVVFFFQNFTRMINVSNKGIAVTD
jgi:hypothetical protein